MDYFVYSKIPGAGKGWSLAVLATSRRDANAYVKKMHGSGKFVYSSKSPKADCAAVTWNAEQILKTQLTGTLGVVSNETD